MLKSTRSGFGKALLKLGETNPDVVVVSADLSSSTKLSDFAKKYPERFFEIGVAENNMMGVAAGLSLETKIPFVSSFAAFSPSINWAVIRQSVCLPNLAVKIASTHAGLLTGPDGATHQALEDLALMQVLPNMTVVVPADYDQAYEATLQSVKINGPVYIRLTRPDTPLLSNFQFSIFNFQIGKAQVLKTGKDVTLVSCGPIIFEAIKAMEVFEKENKKSVELINCHTVKPLDIETLVNSVKKTKRMVTVEDHMVFGGMGAHISVALSQNYPVPMIIMGVKNSFGESARHESELLKKFELDTPAIVKNLKKILKLT
ncbi:MAG: transketolase family protein [Candidatus Shapirobacteria bacterium]|nr:transketolase family protein [Candidatus Shapirobacteria bacterium]